MVWHDDKYKITFKLVITIIDARARYRAAARRLRNTALDGMCLSWRECAGKERSAHEYQNILWLDIFIVLNVTTLERLKREQIYFSFLL